MSFAAWFSSVMQPRRLPLRSAHRRRKPMVLERLEDRTVPAIHTWTGLGTDGNWSTPGNWDNNTAPTAGEMVVQLVFPTGVASNKATTQNIPNLAVDQIDLQDDGYSIAVTSPLALDASLEPDGKIKCEAGTSDAITGGSISGFGTINVGSGATLTISSVLENGPYTKAGAGTLILSGANTFDQQGTLGAGTLVAENDHALGLGGFEIEDGTTLDVQADVSVGFNLIQLDASSSIITSAASAGPGYTGTGKIGDVGSNLAPGQTLTIGGAGDQTFTGTIIGAGGVKKIGNGTSTLTADNTYTGSTTVTAGRLAVNGSQGDSAVSVTGGTLGGDGTVGPLTTTGGIVAPGLEFAPATLTTGKAILASSTFAPIVSGTTGDKLAVFGTVNLTGATLNVRHTGAPTPVGTSLTVIDNDGSTDAVIGTFANTPQGSIVTDNASNFYKINYKGGTGNDVTLTAVAAPKITIANIKVTEGDSGSKFAAFTVHLSAPLTKDLTITFKTQAGTATAGKDYVAITSQTVTIAAGATSCPINVAVKGDKLDEVNETFKVAISKIAGIHGIGGAGTFATATIVDNDPTPTLSISDVKKKEGNSGSTAFAFTVKLSAASGQIVKVNFTAANGTAKSPSDYTQLAGTLTFKPGDTSKTITIKVKGDKVKEANETFTVKLSKALHATLKKGVGTGTIVNDD